MTLNVYRAYYVHLYPFDQIMRFITCDRVDEHSPQYRDLRFECKRGGGGAETDEMISKKYFDRRTRQLFHAQLMRDLPQSIHISTLVPLQLDQTKFGGEPRRKRSALVAMTNDDDYSHSHTPLLKETHSNAEDYLHCVQAIEKELVFDIDGPDFDRFCPCVGGGGGEAQRMLCDTCWLHIEGTYWIALFILTSVLGYERRHLMCVFSGGKGIHWFVNARRAMTLDDQQRLFIHETITMKEDSQLMTWIVRDSTRELSDGLEELFHNNVLVRRNLLAGGVESPFRQWVLNKLYRHYPSVYNQVKKRWDKATDDTVSSTHLWSILKTFEVYRERGGGDARSQVRPSLFLIYRLYYPMIDKGPMKLAKSVKLPFSIHSKTGNIALPVSADFMQSNDKLAQIVTLEDLYTAHTQRQPMPPLFTQGVALLTQWLDQYTAPVVVV